MAENIIENLKNEMISFFGDDTKRINHALKVLDYARKIQSTEGGNELVVDAAALLHDIGIHAAEQKYGSAAGKYQEIEGPPIARDILLKYDLGHEKIEHICLIVANHHSDRNIDTLEFRIIWDADWLVNIPDELDLSDTVKLAKFIDKIFKTNTGKMIAKETFIVSENIVNN